MMDWTRLVSNLLKHISKKLPRDCMLQGYMFASLKDGRPSGQIDADRGLVPQPGAPPALPR